MLGTVSLSKGYSKTKRRKRVFGGFVISRAHRLKLIIIVVSNLEIFSWIRSIFRTDRIERDELLEFRDCSAVLVPLVPPRVLCW